MARGWQGIKPCLPVLITEYGTTEYLIRRVPMISVIPVENGSGTFNVLGIDEGMFCLQGNLTLKQLKELRNEINKAIKEAAHKS